MLVSHHQSFRDRPYTDLLKDCDGSRIGRVFVRMTPQSQLAVSISDLFHLRLLTYTQYFIIGLMGGWRHYWCYTELFRITLRSSLPRESLLWLYADVSRQVLVVGHFRMPVLMLLWWLLWSPFTSNIVRESESPTMTFGKLIDQSYTYSSCC